MRVISTTGAFNFKICKFNILAYPSKKLMDVFLFIFSEKKLVIHCRISNDRSPIRGLSEIICRHELQRRQSTDMTARS